MANALHIDLAGKTVILSSKLYKGTDEERRFLCKAGFGCRPGTSGTAIFGEFLSDGEKCRINGSDVERLAPRIVPLIYAWRRDDHEQ